jgi:hypothetical protein
VFKENLIKYLLVLLVVLVVSDGLLTQFLIDGGLAQEGNPLLQPLVGKNGFLMLKAAGALLCALILWDIYRRFPKLAVIATWCFIAAYGAIMLWNSSILI